MVLGRKHTGQICRIKSVEYLAKFGQYPIRPVDKVVLGTLSMSDNKVGKSVQRIVRWRTASHNNYFPDVTADTKVPVRAVGSDTTGAVATTTTTGWTSWWSSLQTIDQVIDPFLQDSQLFSRVGGAAEAIDCITTALVSRLIASQENIGKKLLRRVPRLTAAVTTNSLQTCNRRKYIEPQECYLHSNHEDSLERAQCCCTD